MSRRTRMILSVFLVFSLVIGQAAIAMAGVTGYITEASDGTVYQYDYNELKTSYTNHVLGLDGDELYLHYENNKESVKAVYDEETGEYVDFEAMSQAYLDLALAGSASSFDMNTYVASDEAVPAEMPATVQAITINEDGEAVETTETVSPVEEVKVTAITAVDDVTIEVTFSDDSTATITDFTPTPLVEGNNTVTFTYNEKEYTEDVTYTAPVQEVTVTAIEDITVTEGDKVVLPETVEVTYDDESTKAVAVAWDADKFDFSKVGTYELTGTIEGTELTAAVKVVVAEAALKVESVSAITKTEVTVAITALEEAKTGMTVAITNNTGAAVAVKPLDLVKGETIATFTFVNPLGVDPKGVWTVGGKTIDLDLQAKLDAVYGAANQVKLNEALVALELTDLNAENIAYYEAELAKVKDSNDEAYVAKADFTKENAQAVVTAGNKAAVEGADVAAVIKVVNEAETEVALLTALQNPVFVRVNADWITAYNNNTLKSATTVKLIQAQINAVNTTKLNTEAPAVTTEIDKDKLTKAKALRTAYMTPDAEGETAKADELAAIERQLAIVKVLEAETAAQLTSAINALKVVDAAYELSMDNFKDANRAAYITALAAAGTTAKDEISEINGILVTVNTKQAAAPIKAIEDAADADKLLAALKAYGDAKYVADANKNFYWNNHATGGNKGTNKFATSTMDKVKIQKAIDEANLTAVTFYSKATVVGINGGAALAAADENKLYAALVAYGNDIKDLSINNKAFYVQILSDGAKKAVVLNEDVTAALGFDQATYTNKADVQGLVDIANIEAIKAQTTSAAGVLAKLQITRASGVKAEYSSSYLDSVDGTVATAATIELKDLDGTNNGRTIAKVETALGEINAAQAATAGIKAVNDATTATALRDILTNLVVDGDITAPKYLNLTNADKLLVAELFLDNDVFTASSLVEAPRTDYAAGEYNGLDDIQTDVEELVTKFAVLRTDMNAVFATTVSVGDVAIADVQAKLAKLVKANYATYDALTGTQKLAATEAFIAAVPSNQETGKYLGGYTTMGDYFAAVDAAIAAIQ